MGWKPKNSPSFLKLLLSPDFADYLPIPPLFVTNYLQEAKMPENPVLATCESGKTWAVTIVKMGRRGYCFKLGWSEFVKDNDLETYDFLLFWLLGRSTFLVAVYSPSGIEKKLTSPTPTFSHAPHQLNYSCKNKNAEVVKEGGEVHLSAASVNPQQTPSFEVFINNRNNYTMFLPARFVKEARILATMRTIVLTNAEGMRWHVELRQRSRQPGMFDLTTGWSTFLRANNIQNGDTIQFLFLWKEGNIGYVKVLNRKGTKRTGEGGKRGKYKRLKAEKESDGIIEAATTSVEPPLHEFIATLGRSCSYRMGLPIWFARGTRLTSRGNTVLKNDVGSEFCVSIKKRYNCYGYDLKTGWATFRKENNIGKGDTCLFQLFSNEGDFIRVKVLKRKGGTRFIKGGCRRSGFIKAPKKKGKIVRNTDGKAAA